MEIIKQLIDLGELFRFLQDWNDLRQTYDNVYTIENRFRLDAYRKEQVLEDTIQTCFLISQHGLKSSIDNEKTKELRLGIFQIRNHLLNYNFSLDDAKIAASRIAYLAKMLETNSKFEKTTLHFDEKKLNRIRDVQLKDDLKILNRLNPILPEAFYYWYLTSRLLNKEFL